MNQPLSRQTFMDAVRGIDAYSVAQALRVLTPGMDWRGCSKGFMAQRYTEPRVPHVDLQRLARMATARRDGNPQWAQVK